MRAIKPLAILALILSGVAFVMMVSAAPGSRAGLWDWRFGLGVLFKWSVYLGIAGAVLGVLGGAALKTAQRKSAWLGLTAVILGLAAISVPLGMRNKASKLPYIHDISTDTIDPPSFVAVAPLRADADNPVEYDEAASAPQRKAYPDIQTIRVTESAEQAYAAALASVRALGWELVDARPEEGRIEATDTTRWFGFKDDVVIRIRQLGEVTLIDARSKSRVGKSDVGKNAERLREFRAELLGRLTNG